jgi:hypothetical protein
MRHTSYLGVFLVFLGTMLSVCAAAQSDSGVSLGDLARSLRRSKEEPKPPAAPTVIDNDNLSQVIDQVENYRLRGKPLFSFDGVGRNFQMTSPDGTCSLSFNANNTALLSTPFMSQDLPQSELAKLDGPANLHGDTLEVSMYNASSWNVREITVGLTIVRRDNTSATDYGTAKLMPAVVEDEARSRRLFFGRSWTPTWTTARSGIGRLWKPRELPRFQPRAVPRTSLCQLENKSTKPCLQLRSATPPADSFRRQIESPVAPIASGPRLAGSRAGVVRAAFDSSMLASSAPLVLPAMIGLFATVS